tara:strand:+ start:3098 stop:3271 length:174 start_codon:yes stop_codon:yes gene_type:complete
MVAETIYHYPFPYKDMEIFSSTEMLRKLNLMEQRLNVLEGQIKTLNNLLDGLMGESK